MSVGQTSLNSGFGATSTAADVVLGLDLTGKAAVVTGGYSGLGLETARVLAKAGAHVTVPARDVERGRAVLGEIENVVVWPMDLLEHGSIDAFAERFIAGGRPLHLLVNSAGIMANPLTRDSRGYESQFVTNHLGHFQLAARLWPALQAARGARVVSVSSLGHRYSSMSFDDPSFERRPYDGYTAYGQSKTANVLFAVELDRRGRSSCVRAFAAHPGSISGTGMQKHLSRERLVSAGLIDVAGKPILDPSRQLKTVEQGAATLLWCATSPQLDGLGGVYCENCDISPMMPDGAVAASAADSLRLTGVMPHAVDPEAASRLWSLSERLTGLTFL